MVQRIIFAVCILLIDGMTFFLPLTALFAAYILIVRPPAFRDWINQLYAGK